MSTPINNAFFKWQDQRAEMVAGMKLPEIWWSRSYEYAWALQYAEPSLTVADMGTGWMYRPFKEALAEICGMVYAVDADERLRNQTPKDNMQFVIADITKHIPLPAASLDRIFCISVLEDLNEMVYGAMQEFSRLLKPDGRVVTTFDVWYDELKPLGKYPGVHFKRLTDAMEKNGLDFDGPISFDKRDAVYHNDFNLACFHAVMVKA